MLDPLNLIQGCDTMGPAFAPSGGSSRLPVCRIAVKLSRGRARVPGCGML